MYTAALIVLGVLAWVCFYEGPKKAWGRFTGIFQFADEFWIFIIATVIGLLAFWAVSGVVGAYQPNRFVEAWNYDLTRIGTGGVSSWFEFSDSNLNTTDQTVKFKADTGEGGVSDFTAHAHDVSVIVDPGVKPHVVRTNVYALENPNPWLADFHYDYKYTLYVRDAKGIDTGFIRTIMIER